MKDKKGDILLGKLGPYLFQFVSDQWQPAPFSHLDFDPISILEEYYSKPSTRISRWVIFARSHKLLVLLSASIELRETHKVFWKDLFNFLSAAPNKNYVSWSRLNWFISLLSYTLVLMNVYFLHIISSFLTPKSWKNLNLCLHVHIVCMTKFDNKFNWLMHLNGTRNK